MIDELYETLMKEKPHFEQLLNSVFRKVASLDLINERRVVTAGLLENLCRRWTTDIFPQKFQIAVEVFTEKNRNDPEPMERLVEAARAAVMLSMFAEFMMDTIEAMIFLPEGGEPPCNANDVTVN